MRITRASIPHFLAINPRLPASRISSFPNLSLAVEVGAGNVETVDVARDDAGDEEERVD